MTLHHPVLMTKQLRKPLSNLNIKLGIVYSRLLSDQICPRDSLRSRQRIASAPDPLRCLPSALVLILA